MQADMEILTTRFLLRDFIDSDESAFVAYQADPRMLEFYGDEAAKPGHAGQLLQDFRAWAQELPRRNFQLAIVRRDEAGRLVGCCGLRGVDSAARSAELGIELAPGEWGRYGYAIEVMRALAKFGFEELRLDELYGSTVSANVRIARLASSLGAVATRLDTSAWMTARGWSQVEWRRRENSGKSTKPRPGVDRQAMALPQRRRRLFTGARVSRPASSPIAGQVTGLLRHPEHVLGEILIWVLSDRRVLGEQCGVLHLESRSRRTELSELRSERR